MYAFVINKFCLCILRDMEDRYVERIITIPHRLLIFFTFEFFLLLIKRKTRKSEEKKLAGV